MECASCLGQTATGLDPWHFQCRCGHEQSTLLPIIATREAAGALDEGKRSIGLRELREANFNQLVEFLKQAGLLDGDAVIDVGCAHGWFLDTLSRNGFAAIGIEPDIAVGAGRADVLRGFFPEAIPVGASYDAITFNDVYEHLPNVNDVAQHCWEALNARGLVLVNSPNAGGPIYQVAKALRRLGVHSLWDRMWQKGLPSPHLSYFTNSSLRTIFDRAGFDHVGTIDVRSVSISGLWNRIRYTRIPLPMAAVVYVGIVAALPILGALASDTQAALFRKRG